MTKQLNKQQKNLVITIVAIALLFGFFIIAGAPAILGITMNPFSWAIIYGCAFYSSTNKKAIIYALVIALIFEAILFLVNRPAGPLTYGYLLFVAYRSFYLSTFGTYYMRKLLIKHKKTKNDLVSKPKLLD